MQREADVVVIGMGPGGEEVAGSLAEAGLAVIGVERELLGGECPYWGCVPSKMIIRGADLIEETHRVNGVSGNATVMPDWSPVATRIRKEATDSWDDKVAVDRFVGKGGTFVRGSAKLQDNKHVVVGDDLITVDQAIVIATGTAPVIPPIPGLAEVPYWTNREAIAAETLPQSLIVLGGGAIGLELAQAFSRFGVTITVVEGADRLVPLEEPESSSAIEKVLGDEGLKICTGVTAQSVSGDENSISVGLSDGTTVTAEKLLVAVGRRPRVKELGLESAGIDENARAVEVDAQMRAADGLWAVGDCTGKGAFTHMAMYQARIATANILGKPIADAQYHAVPRVTFTDPEIGSVGMTEQQARDAGLPVHIGMSQVSSSARGWIHGPGNAGHIKLVEDTDAGVLVGATSMGPWGGEVLSMLAVAVHAKVPTQTLREMIYAYPTFHRGVEDALRDLDSE